MNTFGADTGTKHGIKIGKPDSAQKTLKIFSVLEKLVGGYKHLLDQLNDIAQFIGFYYTFKT